MITPRIINCTMYDNLLPPATKLWQGNVVTPVCDSVHRRVSVQGVSVQGVSIQGVSVQGVSVQGVSVQEVSVWGSLSGGLSVWLCVGGMHPTGMHSSSQVLFPFQTITGQKYEIVKCYQ